MGPYDNPISHILSSLWSTFLIISFTFFNAFLPNILTLYLQEQTSGYSNDLTAYTHSWHRYFSCVPYQQTQFHESMTSRSCLSSNRSDFLWIKAIDSISDLSRIIYNQRETTFNFEKSRILKSNKPHTPLSLSPQHISSHISHRLLHH